MPTEVLMPRLADTLVEGTVARWLKAANDVVQAGEPIAEIETDKVTTELTAPTSGTLGELLVTEGETVPIGTPLVRIRTQGEQEPSPRSRETPTATGEATPVPPTRRASAARMSSVRQIPTGCAVVEADVTELEEFYRKERDAWLENFGFPLTYTPFFLYALAQSLRAWPAVRQALRNNQREPRDAVHV